MSLNIEIEKCIEKYLGYEIRNLNKSATFNGKWRYHDWECDTDSYIWSINFDKYKVYSYIKYDKDLDNIKKFSFIGCKFGNIIITDNDLDITFHFIKELIDRERLIKSLEEKSKDELRKFNTDNISFVRELKLTKLGI